MPEQRVPKVSDRDVLANRRRGGDIRILLSPKTVAATSGFMGVLTLAPGEYVAEHYHPYSEEFFYVFRGRIVLRVDGETVELGPGEAAMVPIRAHHRAENTGTEPAQAVFHLSPLAPRPDLGHVDLEPLPDAAAPAVEVGGPA
jgi:putative monooxygenase